MFQPLNEYVVQFKMDDRNYTYTQRIIARNMIDAWKMANRVAQECGDRRAVACVPKPIGYKDYR